MQHTSEEHRARRRVIDARYRQRHKEELAAYQKAYHRTYQPANKVRLAAQKKAYDQANPEQARARHRVYVAKDPTKYKADELARTHKRREARAGRPRPDKCEVCGSGGRIVFDHCHQRSHFRGWLCNRCNTVLGFVKDDMSLLLKLAAYLKRSAKSDPPQRTLSGL